MIEWDGIVGCYIILVLQKYQKYINVQETGSNQVCTFDEHINIYIYNYIYINHHCLLFITQNNQVRVLVACELYKISRYKITEIKSKSKL